MGNLPSTNKGTIELFLENHKEKEFIYIFG